jgi:hypothetical protein
MSCIRIGSRTNETENNEKKDGGRKRKVQKKMAAGQVFEEDTTNKINI